MLACNKTMKQGNKKEQSHFSDLVDAKGNTIRRVEVTTSGWSIYIA